jgi:hypothetical protein
MPLHFISTSIWAELSWAEHGSITVQLLRVKYTLSMFYILIRTVHFRSQPEDAVCISIIIGFKDCTNIFPDQTMTNPWLFSRWKIWWTQCAHCSFVSIRQHTLKLNVNDIMKYEFFKNPCTWPSISSKQSIADHFWRNYFNVIAVSIKNAECREYELHRQVNDEDNALTASFTDTECLWMYIDSSD